MMLRQRLFSLLLLAWLAGLCLAAPARAQTTITADWTALGKANMGVIPTGTALNVGPNTITIDTARITDGDANDANFTNYYSTGMLAYYTGQIGSQTGTLIYTTDHSVFDVGDYFETVYTLNTAVTNLRFTLANVDRYTTNPYFHDGVTIEYDTGSGTWQNLRSLTSAYTLGSAVGTTTLGGVQGFHGTAYSGGITSTTGDIRVNFGTTTVKRVRIRYLFGQATPGNNPSGDWQYMGLSDFTWQQTGVSTSDLSLGKTVSNANPAPGASLSYTLTLTNSGTATASGVVVRDVLPDGFSFVSASGYGTYNSSTGEWTIPTIASGASRVITISGTVTAPAGVTITNVAEVWSSLNYDPDSLPGNTVSGEDDQASVTFTVSGTRTAGTPPTLFCPRGSTLFDWDLRSWAAGSLSNSYAVTGMGNIGFAITSGGTWVNDAAFGGLSPTLSNQNTGGLGGAQVALHQYLDFANQAQTATTTISLPSAAAGAQFTVFDVDYAASDFADKLTVTGSYNGTTVNPVLTNGVVNYVVGNSAIGDGSSSGTSGDGNVVVTFSQPIDTITIVYGNANTAPADPDGQAIALHDITFCTPYADLSVTKVSAVVSDPVNGSSNPKAIPGALVEYVIAISNSGISATDSGSVVITDAGPAQASLCFDTNGSGDPLVFDDGSPASGLSFAYGGIADAGDDLAFSADGGTSWTYEPVLDADGCDSAITHFRIIPDGQIAADRSASFRASYRID